MVRVNMIIFGRVLSEGVNIYPKSINKLDSCLKNSFILATKYSEIDLLTGYSPPLGFLGSWPV